jgi:3-dehydroquinate dehydratase-2
MSILIVNGPNLNTLGTREPEIYGSTTLAEVDAALVAQGRAAGVAVETFQSNHEGEIVDRVQRAAAEGVRFVVINPGAFTHTSLAIRDAFAAVSLPFVEVHISNVHAREEFRHHSYLSGQAVGVVVGLGVDGYRYALDFAIKAIQEVWP